jgi:hypothetical protein
LISNIRLHKSCTYIKKYFAIVDDKASWHENLPSVQWNSSSLNDLEPGTVLKEKAIAGLLLDHTYRFHLFSIFTQAFDR